MNSFSTFQRFSSTEAASDLIELLKNNGIEFEVVDNSFAVDLTFGANTQIEKEVKLKETDFEKVNVLLENIAADNIKDHDNTHYLFDFTEEELIEIIKKPDEWSKEDYLITKKILEKKGIIFSTQQLIELKQERINELAKPESADKLWTMLGYLFSLISGIIGVFIGWHLATFKKTLPNGQKVYNYTEPTRLHGRIIFSIGLVYIIGWMLYIVF